jgi:phospholipid-transporting ATPase
MIFQRKVNTSNSARTSSLVEELGQVDYIFSDKTGTLTRNIMEFKMVSIGGVPYAEVVPEDKRLRVDMDGTEQGYYDFKMLKQHKADHINSANIHEFLTLLAVCHTVIPEHVVSTLTPGRERSWKVGLSSFLPRRGSTSRWRQKVGIFVPCTPSLTQTRRPRSVTIAIHGKNFEYEILNVCEFNSTRKRMSVICRTPDGQIKLYTKGADTVIFERLVEDSPYLIKTSAHLEDYASEGLRTLCLAYRDVSEDEYASWKLLYEQAATKIHNRQQKLDEAAELIEKDLELLGATAIEDKLQDGVPDTIHTLMEAGIKLWVLTGDRQETAINIGYSCKLITPDMNILVCNHDTHFETKEYLEQKLINVKSSMGIGHIPPRLEMDSWYRFWHNKSKSDNGKFDKEYGRECDPLALVIDGKSLKFALEADVCEVFLELAILCKAVVCCRVSPLQKALVDCL